LGGPCAPALRIALALGEGGGRTTPVPEEWLASVLAFAGVSAALAPDCDFEDSPLPASDCSSGICTFSFGLFAPNCILSARDGGGNSVDPVRLGTGVSLCVRVGGEWDGEDCCWGTFSRFDGCGAVSFSGLMSILGSVACFPMPQCCANNDRLSSIGVKILRDLAGFGACIRDWSS